MASDDTDEHGLDDAEGGDTGSDSADVDGGGVEVDVDIEPGTGDGDQRGDGVAGVTVDEVDQRIVDLLSWILDTETRAKIYVHLLANPGSTSEEVARGTGLYPSTVREALAELHDEERVSRRKRSNEGAGNNPYEYTAIQPSELVGSVVDQVQRELNTIFTLDRVLDRRRDDESAIDEHVEPVTITVDDGAGSSSSDSLSSRRDDDPAEDVSSGGDVGTGVDAGHRDRDRDRDRDRNGDESDDPLDDL